MSEFRRKLMTNPTSDYVYELNNYTLDGDNWIDTGLYPYNTGKNFEIVITLDLTLPSSVPSYNQYILSLCDMYINGQEKYRGIRLLYDGAWGNRYYMTSGFGNNYPVTPKTGIHTFKYTYINGSNIFYLDDSQIGSVNRTITSSHQLRIGIGNYDEWSNFLTQSGRRWHGTIVHFHLKYLE